MAGLRWGTATSTSTRPGTTSWLRIRGYISTVAKHGDNIYDALRDAITGNPWRPPVTC